MILTDGEVFMMISGPLRDDFWSTGDAFLGTLCS